MARPTLGDSGQSPWAICDRSGFKVRLSDTVKEPITGFRVARRFADKPRPSDFPQVVRPERSVVPDARPEPPDVAVGTVTAEDL